MIINRIFLIVLDGLGVGSAPDAGAFGDEGSDTLLHIAQTCRLDCPGLAGLGLGNLYPDGLPGIEASVSPKAAHCRLSEVSLGKDTTTGHWELMGIIRESQAPTFPNGFPDTLLSEFKRQTGRGVIGNRPASGTQIIQQLGPEHLATGNLIVYTSADSVFQVAASVDIVPLSELYSICETARELLHGELGVDRVIARPFSGDPQSGFTRTPDRRDFALPPPGPTSLDVLKAGGLDVIGIGKISDIFAGRGLTRSLPVHGNMELMDTLQSTATEDWHGLAFVNLVDFDMLYGHRNNPQGFADALMEFDAWLTGFLPVLRESDLLVITADHGNDPTTPSTDHSREQVPLLITSRELATNGGFLLKPEPGFQHVGKTITTLLGVDSPLPGTPLLSP